MAQATKPKLNTRIINHYLDRLSREIRIDGVLLFGSYAWGKPNKHSDIDLAIISPDFAKQDYSSRIGWLHQQRDRETFKLAMDIFGYTPEEFASMENFSATMAKAKKDGIWLRPMRAAKT